jgi:hypothetical protein
MKITIAPSIPEPGWTAVTIDTMTNEDSTTNITFAALAAIVASGHNTNNTAYAAEQWAVENKSTKGTK